MATKKPGICCDCPNKLPEGRKAGHCESCKLARRKLAELHRKRHSVEADDAGEREAIMMARGRTVPRG